MGDKAKQKIKGKNEAYGRQKKKVPVRFVLLKDLVIPAGTVFEEAPQTVTHNARHYSTIIGLENDSHGDLTYDIMGDDFEKLVGSGKWFAIMDQDVYAGE